MIIHIDMDAFYASVEERENPDLKGKPLIVGGEVAARGVAAAANYAARQYGIHSAMPTATAIKRCPDLLIIKPRGELYSEVSKQIREIFRRYTPIVEPLSLDEAFLDASGSTRLHGDAVTIGRKIKQDIKCELDLVASVGVAANKFLAKLASDFDKPDGFTVIYPGQEQAFLDPLPVGQIWGVGKVANKKLTKLGIKTVSDLRAKSVEFLNQLFGQYGEQLWRLARGIDDRRVTVGSEVKSVSQETTFDQDIRSLRAIESTTLYLTEGVCYRLRESALKGRTVILKIRFDDFKTITRSKSLDFTTNQTNDIWAVARTLLEAAVAGKRFAIRLIGVAVSNFSERPLIQSDLFAPNEKECWPDEETQGNRKAVVLDKLSDEVKHKFGKQSIKRGRSIGR